MPQASCIFPANQKDPCEKCHGLGSGITYSPPQSPCCNLGSWSILLDGRMPGGFYDIHIQYMLSIYHININIHISASAKYSVHMYIFIYIYIVYIYIHVYHIYIPTVKHWSSSIFRHQVEYRKFSTRFRSSRNNRKSKQTRVDKSFV